MFQEMFYVLEIDILVNIILNVNNSFLFKLSKAVSLLGRMGIL